MKAGYSKSVAWEREWMIRLKDLALVLRKIDHEEARQNISEAVELLDAYVQWHVLPEVMGRPIPTPRAIRRLHWRYRVTGDAIDETSDAIEAALEMPKKNKKKEKNSGNDRRDVSRTGVAIRDSKPSRGRRSKEAPA